MSPSKWQHSPKWNGKFSWLNTSFLLLTPLAFALLAPWQLMREGLTLSDFFLFAFMTTTTGLGVTAGYHRLFSHQTFEASPLVKFLFLVFGAGAFQNSAFKWCSDHRYHHRFQDKEGDPYNIQRGFFYAHMGWIFFHDPEGRSYDNAKDLAEDKLVAWQHKYYLPLAVLVCFGLPTLIGWLMGRPFAGFVWGGLFRLLFVHHGTFLINSLAHTYGDKPYSTKVTARDNWWLAFFTNGEGFHNFHHAFGNDYRNGVRWYHWDPTKWLILLCQATGHAKNLQRTPDAHLLKARMEVSLEKFKKDWNHEHEMPHQLETMREHLEHKLQEFQQKYKEFQAWKEAKKIENARWSRVRARYWRRRLHAERLVLEQSIHEYMEVLRHTQRYGAMPAMG